MYVCMYVSETTWCPIGFHGNNSQINYVTGGRHLEPHFAFRDKCDIESAQQSNGRIIYVPQKTTVFVL